MTDFRTKQIISSGDLSFGQSVGVASGVVPAAVWALKWAISFIDNPSPSNRKMFFLMILLYGGLGK
jgi:hypothetical protein